MIFPQQHSPKINSAAPDPARLYLLYASESPKVIILRRGPSKWTEQILWNTDTDTFVYGQWIHGGLKGYACDLSPSGDYLLYFAQKYYGKDPAYETFTAISKTPTFTALTLWPLGNSWGGGGIFIDEKTIWLNHREDTRYPGTAQYPHPDHPNTLFTVVPFEDYSSKLGPQHYRMLREGWKLLQEAEAWELKSPKSRYSLVYKRGYYLRNDISGAEELLPDVIHANFDHKGRLVMARYGSVLVSDLQEPLQAHVLVDLNGQKPPQKSVGDAPVRK